MTASLTAAQDLKLLRIRAEAEGKIVATPLAGGFLQVDETLEGRTLRVIIDGDATPSEITTFAQGGAEPTAADRIRSAFAELAHRKDDFVSLARLRDRLVGMSRAEQDAALLDLDLEPGVYLVPEDDQRSLTATERAASIRIGCEDKHRISIEER